MATTWDAGFKSSGVTLSSGNLVATVTSGISSVITNRVISGPTYFQITIGSSLTGNISVGLAGRGFNHGNSWLLGTDNISTSIGYAQTGTVKVNNATVMTIQTFAANAVIDVAYNPLTQLVWFRTNNGNWNNSGTADPATNTGGISFGSGTLCPAFSASIVTPNQSCTAVFTSGFTNTPPTGYITIDTTQTTAFVGDGLLNSCAKSTTVGSAKSYTLFPGYEYRLWSPAGTAKTISGVLKELGVNVARVVRIYDEVTGAYLGQVTSDASTGAFSIPALGRSKVFVVAFDPTSYNALVFDNVTPV